MRARLTLLRSAALAALVSLVAATGARAQDAPPPTAPVPATEPTPAPEAEPVRAAEPATPAEPMEKAPYFRRGLHRVRLSLTYNPGGTARDAGVLASPVTGEPGSPRYPAETPLRVELDGGAQANFGYTYFLDEKWGVDLALGHQASTILDSGFDEAEMDAQFATTNLTQAQKDHLRARIVAHSQPHDMSVTYLDFGAVRVFAPKSKWPFEIGAGLGWAWGSLGDATLGDRVVYERLITSRVVRQGDTAIVANEYPVDDGVNPVPAFVDQGCIEDNDPCIEMTQASGLTWNASGTLHRAFTDKFMLDLGARVRFVEQVLDPGDSFITTEFGVGISFLFGGK